MIALVDNHIVERLEEIRMDGSRLKVYAPGADRSKGKTMYPCIAVSRHQWFTVNRPEARPDVELFRPSADQAMVQLPRHEGSIEISGPASWTRTPYPTPVNLHYQLDLLATDSRHPEALLRMLFEAIPPGYYPRIGDRHVLFVMAGMPTNLDELEKPVFRTAVRYELTGIMLDRQHVVDVPSVTDPQWTFET